MNENRLKIAEKRFFDLYPKGFESEELLLELKKHKVGKMTDFAVEVLSKKAMKRELETMDNIQKMISRSSLVSVFEKMRFRDLIQESDVLFKKEFVHALYTMLHVNQQAGFEQIVSLLEPYKLAKWPIVTVLLTYYNPTVEVFVKPTTVKRIIEVLELEDLTYTPKVDYVFYVKYRKAFNQMKSYVDPSLSVTNGHFSGFLMMTL